MMGTGADTGGRGVARELDKAEVKKLHNNKRQSLRMQYYLTNVGTPPPHNLATLSRTETS